MEVNHLPKLSKDNETGCCPRFNPKDWDGKTFVFKDKLFVRMVTRSFLYMPLNLGSQMTTTWAKIMEAKANSSEFAALSYDISPWKAEHYLTVSKKVKGLENVKISGKFVSKVFEGPYKDAPKWIEKMKKFVTLRGKAVERVYLYYTTCPKCQKVYGKNYVVALAKV
jgi:hypothetical protein